MSSELRKFIPRPEAQATRWSELMPPVRRAVHDLLVRIHGSHYGVRDKNTGKSADSLILQTGNCFLVYGSRGTGKTTVLLNAQKAVCRKKSEDFFIGADASAKNNETADEKKATIKLKADAKENAESLRKDDVIWLDILNLEPLPSEANLLTVLLTQVRNALRTHSDKRPRNQRSVFEEEADSAQQLLNRLIGDTTLMWQNISEPDTRNISARQVKAADIYADFPERFKKAMDKLIDELSDTRGSDSKVSIVLPIDNIDRSTEHLQSIVKLAQLVFHPNLWLVMAGDRVEVETFLERGYWKELIRSSDGAGARGKIDSDGEDEALVMARRQANATAQKLWPANHRVEIDFLTPKQTLEFEYKQGSGVNASKKIKELLELDVSLADDEETLKLAYKHQKYFVGNGEDDPSIRGMLKKVQIPTTDKQRKGEDSGINLLNLFYMEKKVTGKDEGDIQPDYLTRAAYHGLSLPARSVLDLWQLLDWLTNDSSSSCNDFKAEKVARTMLRNAIASSTMSNVIAQDFQNKILRRGEKRGTILFFSKTSLKVDSSGSKNRDFEFPLKAIISNSKSSYPSLRSQLELNNVEDLVLYLQSEKSEETELLPLVAAWLVVLYDILLLAEPDITSWVTYAAEVAWPNVSVHHTFATQINASQKRKNELCWKAPDQGLFLGRDLFKLNWQGFLKKIKTLSEVELSDQSLVPRLLAASWIFYVLKTSFILISSIDPKLNFQKDDEIAPILESLEQNLKQDMFLELSNNKNKLVLEFEKNIMQLSDVFYRLIQKHKKLPFSDLIDRRPIIDAAYEVMLATGKWLETELIYFLTYAYVPIKSSKVRFYAMLDSLSLDNEFSLRKYWQENLLFILAEQEEKLAAAKDRNPKDSGDNSDTETITETTTLMNGKTSVETIKKTTKKTIEPLGKLLFTDLYDLHAQLNSKTAGET